MKHIHTCATAGSFKACAVKKFTTAFRATGFNLHKVRKYKMEEKDLLTASRKQNVEAGKEKGRNFF